jgi:hypothetical protein
MPDPDSPQPVFEFYRSWVEPSGYFPTSETGVVLSLFEKVLLIIWFFSLREV